MTREEAIEVYNGLINTKIKEAFEFFAPELRESEDERIRKWLIQYIKDTHPIANYWNGAPTISDVLSWLEKQKEPDECPEYCVRSHCMGCSIYERLKEPEDIIGKAMSYFGAESLLDNANGLSDFEKFTAWLYCEFLRGLPKKLNQEYIKEQTKVILDAAQKELCKMPNSTELIEMWDAEKAMLQEKDFRGDTWRIAQNAFMDGFARGTCVKFEKQKEQKPVLIAENDNWYICIKDFYAGGKKWASVGDLVQAKNGMYMMGRDDISEWFRRAYFEEVRDAFEPNVDTNIPEQKPVVSREKILYHLFQNGSIPLSDYLYLTGEQKPWKVGENAHFTPEQKPEEWSEEDEAIRIEAIKLLSNPSLYEVCEHLREESVDWLKTLHTKVNVNSEKVSANSEKVNVNWSEEDKRKLNRIYEVLGYAADDKAFLKSKRIIGDKEAIELQDFLKSLRPQPKVEWNKQDIDMLNWLIRCCEKEHEELCNDKYGHQDIISDLKRDCRKKWDWLESLKNKVVPQLHWKPTEEQMKALLNAEGYLRAGLQHDSAKTIAELYEQLKQLT